jgi:hypothetical protein
MVGLKYSTFFILKIGSKNQTAFYGRFFSLGDNNNEWGMSLLSTK